MKFRLRIYTWYLPFSNVSDMTDPLMDAYFDNYSDVIAWLNTHMGLNFSEKGYLIKIETVII